MMNRISTTNNYRERINKVLLYINNHLGEKIDLAKMADMAHFSPFHFHRIMKAYLNESIGAYIIRVRLETAATLLLFANDPIGDIAWKMGYESPAAFTKAFQKRFGTSPSDYRQNKGSLEYNKIFMSDLKSIKMELKPKIKEIKPKKVIYIHSIGDYNELGPVWERLTKFMQKKKLFSFGTECLGLSYDDPEVTDTEKLRYDACFTVSKEVKPEGEVGYKEIEGGLFAIFRHKGPYSKLSETYDQIYKNWLSTSGYELRDVPPLEVYLSDPEKTKPENLKTDIYVGIIK
jgi:AraC family transcriptional regulator